MAIKEKRCRQNNKGGMITSVCMYGKSKLYFSNISLVGAESAPTFTIWGRKAPPEFKNGSILRPRFLKSGI